MDLKELYSARAKVECLPLVTVGVITLNREWIIGYMLDSLFSQSYPMEKIYLVVVDGGSTDGTVDVIKNKVKNSNIYGYKIIVTHASIPEARNICLDMAKGEVLYSWDSDEILNKTGLEQLVEIIIDGKADLSTAMSKDVFLNSLDEIKTSIDDFYEEWNNVKFEGIEEVVAMGMGHTAISMKVIKSGIKFDPDLTWGEDTDFGSRARENGFNIINVKNVMGIHIKLNKLNFTDIYTDMPLKLYLKAMPKKARARIEPNSEINLTSLFSFYRENKRFTFYLAYLFMMVISLYGLLMNNLLYLVSFPFYLSFYLISQVKRRGLKNGLKMTFRSVIGGMPYAYLQLYYQVKYMIMGARRRMK